MIHDYLLIGFGVCIALHCAYFKKVLQISWWRILISLIASLVLWPIALFAQFYPNAF